MFIPYKIEEEHAFTGKPWVVYSFCVIYLLTHVILYRHFSSFERDNVFYEYGCVPVDFRWWSPFTCTFLHGGIMHLIGNLYFFWIYGRTCEKAIGSLKFLLLYLLGAWGSVLVQIWTVSVFVNDEPTIGASGAISAVLGAFLVLFPTYRVRFLVFSVVFSRPLPTHGPAYFVLGSWFLLQIFDTLQLGGEVVGVAFWAHVAGFAVGAVIGSLYLFLDHLAGKKYEFDCVNILKSAGKVFLAGGDPVPVLNRLPDSEWKELRNKQVLDDTLLRCLNETEPQRLFDCFYQEFLAARNEKNDGKALFCYFQLVERFGPEHLNHDVHYCAATMAAELDQFKIAVYAYYHAVLGRSGIDPGVDKMLAGMIALLERHREPERARTLAGLLNTFLPYSPYVRRDLVRE